MMKMKKNRIIRIVSFCLALLLFPMIPSEAADEDTAYDWYFSKNETHERPSLDSNLSFLKDYKDFYYCDRHPEGKVIYLTFDAGYENGNVEKILDALNAHHATGAFFVLENLIKRNPELVKRMIDEGHLVCNHTAKHPDMAAISDKTVFSHQLTDLEKVYNELTEGGEMPKYYRPPKGRFTKRNLKYLEELGYKTVLWSYAYADWDNARQPDPDYAVKEVLAHTHPGMVILLHPTSATNAAIMDRLLTLWEEEGYRFGSLDELCGR